MAAVLRSPFRGRHPTKLCCACSCQSRMSRRVSTRRAPARAPRTTRRNWRISATNWRAGAPRGTTRPSTNCCCEPWTSAATNARAGTRGAANIEKFLAQARDGERAANARGIRGGNRDPAGIQAARTGRATRRFGQRREDHDRARGQRVWSFRWCFWRRCTKASMQPPARFPFRRASGWACAGIIRSAAAIKTMPSCNAIRRGAQAARKGRGQPAALRGHDPRRRAPGDVVFDEWKEAAELGGRSGGAPASATCQRTTPTACAAQARRAGCLRPVPAAAGPDRTARLASQRDLHRHVCRLPAALLPLALSGIRRHWRRGHSARRRLCQRT